MVLSLERGYSSGTDTRHRNEKNTAGSVTTYHDQLSCSTSADRTAKHKTQTTGAYQSSQQNGDNGLQSDDRLLHVQSLYGAGKRYGRVAEDIRL